MSTLRRLSIILCMLTTVSCGLADAQRLLLWQGFKFSEVALLKDNVAAFEKDWNASHEQKIDIVVAQVPFADMVRKLKSAALAGQVPDMAFVDANSMVTLAYGGVARALDTLPGFPSEGIDGMRGQYVAGAYDTNVVTLKGSRHLFGLPAQTTTLALFWNKKLFRERADRLRAAGLDPDRAPLNWDEFIKYGEIITQADRGVYAFGMNASLWFTVPFINEYKAELARRDEQGKLVAAFYGPRAEAAFSRKVDFYLKSRIEGGAWREGSLDPDQGFLNQKYAMILSGPWMIENFRSSGLDFGVALIPSVPLEQARMLGLLPGPDCEGPVTTTSVPLTAGNIGGQNMMVSSVTKHPDVAFAFARYFASEPVQRQWAEKLGQIPVNMAAQQNLDLSAFPEIPVFIEQVRTARPLPPLPFGSMIETEIFNPEMNLVLQGKQTVPEALGRICKSLQLKVLNPVNKAEQATRVK